MLNSFLTVGQQVVYLFVIVLVGYVLGKAGLMNDKVSLGMSELMLYVVIPTMTIVSFQRPREAEGFRNFCIVTAMAVVIHLASIAIAHLAVRDPDDQKRRIYRFSVVMSNCGFMGFPLEEAMLGPIGIFYGSAYSAVFNVVGWTYGLRLLSGAKGKLSARSLLLNPGILGIAIALALYLPGIRLPGLLLTPMTYLSSLNTPVPMLVVGYQLSRVDFRAVLGSRSFWLAAALRLLVVPAAALGLCLALGLDRDVLTVLVIAASTPAAALLTMMANKYSPEKALPSAVVAGETILSVLTMPVVVGLAMALA